MGMEVVVGLVIAWAIGKARRVGQRIDGLTDEALDRAVDRVWTVVSQALGDDPAVERLVREARDTGTASAEARHQAQVALEAAARRDPSFATALRTAIADNHPQSPTAVATSQIGSAGSIATGQITAGGSVRLEATNKVVNRAVNFAQQNPRSVLIGGIGLLVLLAIFASCVAIKRDQQSGAPNVPAGSLVTSAPATVPATTTSAGLSGMPSHGLLTAALGQDYKSLEYGVLDVATGSYLPFRKFSTTTAAQISGYRDDVSPDWKLLGATMAVGRDTHAGWIDTSGNFTDVTAQILRSAPPRSDFAKPLIQAVAGFDSAGAFYFEDETGKDDDTGSTIYRVQVANPSSAVEFAHIERGALWYHRYYWNLNHDLTPFSANPDVCPSVREVNDFVWLDPDRFITAAYGGGELLIWNIHTTMCPWDTGGRQYESTLLSNMTSYAISDPRINPAKDTIMFFSDTQNFAGMYTVPLAGGTPTRTGLTRAQLRDHRIVRWI
ncbi:hypothetical protein ACWELJ_29885 [Nocardia sp. NPDC004582]